MTLAATPKIKRIAMLSVHTCPLAMLGGKKTGGMNVYVRDFSRELGRQGIFVDVFTRSQDDCVPRVVHELGSGGRVIHIPAGPEKPIPVDQVGNHLDEFTAGVLAFATSENIQYDLIHSHYWLSGLVADKLRDTWQVPIIHMFHTLGHMKNQIAQSNNQRASEARLAGEYKVMALADKLIAATLAEEAQLKELYDADPAKIAIIPPGVDLERFQPIAKDVAKKRVGIPCGDTNILFAGRIEPLKGIDTMLRAMALIQEQRPDVLNNACMAIIGGDPWADDLDEEMARLQQLRTDLDIHDLVTFLGAKDQEILPNYYAAAEVVVMPSHYESFGMVALEAMAMGTPVIASEVGGLAHLVKHGVTGYHVPSRNPEALAARIYEMLSNQDCRQQMGQQARNYARQYDWANIVNRMMAVYEDSVSGKIAVE
ncbi:glycosyltransferase [Candidatus Leptofilum sp.]|uniref:glycosyltransferase n=1 Tax=Candidatus Leptofilum sp. TaxID=3241576 RepID=UPI003B5999DB